VRGGSHTYVNRMLEDLGPRVSAGDPVTSVRREAGTVSIRLASGVQLGFDQVVLACHADEALALLADPLPIERDILARFAYQPNRTLLHTDTRLMPRNRRVWSSWNYLASQGVEQVDGVSVTYWMNRLQGLETAKNYFVSLNPLQEPGEGSLIAEMTYHHPVFDAKAMNAQHRLSEIQGRDRLWYTGSYFGYGFHEDALRASVELAERFGVRAPWLSQGKSRAVETLR
jgi:predicted NAD/FAD-binding protein